MSVSAISLFGAKRCQLVFSFKGRAQKLATAERLSFTEARDIVIASVAGELGCPVSDIDVRDSRLDYLAADSKAEIVDLSCRNRWACRIVSPYPGEPKVCDELTLVEARDQVELYFASYCAVEENQLLAQNSMPEMLKIIALRLNLGDCLAYTPKPIVVNNEEWVKWLWRYIESPERLLTICLITQSEPPVVFDDRRAAERGFGFCHVMIIPRSMVAEFRRHRPRSCDCTIQEGIVSFVYPSWCLKKGISHGATSFARLRAEMVKQLEDERGLDLSAMIATDDQLFDEVQGRLNNVVQLPVGMISFSHVEQGWRKVVKPKEPELEQRIVELESSLGEVEKVKDTLNGDVETWQAWYAELEAKHKAAQQEAAKAREELAQAKSEVLRLRALLWEQQPQTALRELVYPDTYEQMPAWCELHLQGKLVLHPPRGSRTQGRAVPRGRSRLQGAGAVGQRVPRYATCQAQPEQGRAQDVYRGDGEA